MPNITRYQVQFHPGVDKGRIGVELDDGRFLTLPIGSIDELLLVTQMVQKGPVRIDPNGALDTGLRPVGS